MRLLPPTETMGGLAKYMKGYLMAFWLFQVLFVYAQEGYLRGKVTNGSEGLPSVVISVGGLNLLTDTKGLYYCSLDSGSYKITVNHLGYKMAEELVEIRSGETQTLDFILEPNYQLGEVVILGSRSRIQRSNLNTAVPVAVFSQKTMQQTGQVSLTQVLNFLAPSLNASGEVLNEPVTLRGLDPNHVLILLNGTRYHNMAWINGGSLKGQYGRGSVGNDLNSIPPSSIEKIEVLRDGAAAQYGSDAIAGIINIVLKESIDGASAFVQGGQFYKGDGDKLSVGFNHGMALNKRENKGFLNLSGDFRLQDFTNRGGEYQGTVYYEIPNSLSQTVKDSLLFLDHQMVSDRGFNRKEILDQVGNSKFVVAGLLLNGAYPITDNVDFFWTASYNKRKVYREQSYRLPKARSRVNLELFPDGYQPLSKTGTTDVSVISGLKGVFRNDWYWDLTSGFGSNSLSSNISNTNNASQSYLGKAAQTDFYNGKTVYAQLTNNLNISKEIRGLTKVFNLVNFSTGLEWRLESIYEKPGEEASWKNYDNTYRKLPGTGGTSPDAVINCSRNNLGFYLELEAELNNRFLINLAGRYEYYSDFGGNLASKLAARYKIADALSLRVSASNGFRAPSLQQRYTSTIFESFQNIGGVLIPSTRGIFPNDHPVVNALGVPSLTAEKSINLSSGVVLNMSNRFSLTVDAYWLQFKDRIVLSGLFFRNSNQSVDALLDQYPEFNQIDQLAFFANAINTRTKGVEMVFQGYFPLGTSQLDMIFSANFSQTRLYGGIKTADNLPEDALNTNVMLNVEEKSKIETGQPSSKMVLNISYKKGKTGFNLNNTRFGCMTIESLVDANKGIYSQESFSPKIVTDLNIDYRLTELITLSVGVNNMFNVYPDKIKNYENSSQGMRIYSPELAPFAFNGGFYFVNTRFRF